MQSAGDGTEGNSGLFERGGDGNQGAFSDDSGAETCVFWSRFDRTGKLGLYDNPACDSIFCEATGTDVAKIRLKWYNSKDYNIVKEGETDVETEDSEKTEESEACETALQRTSEAYVTQGAEA